MRRKTSKLKGTPRPVAGKPVVASASATGKPLYVAAKKPAATQTAKKKRPPRPRPVRPNKKLKGTPRPVAGRPSR